MVGVEDKNHFPLNCLHRREIILLLVVTIYQREQKLIEKVNFDFPFVSHK